MHTSDRDTSPAEKEGDGTTHRKARPRHGCGHGDRARDRTAAEGARVTLTARTRERLGATKAEIGAAAFVAPADIRDRAQVDDAFSAAAAAQGPLYALVACSGTGGPNGTGPEDRFEDLVATNLTGTYWCVRAAERHLEGGPGARHVVVVASILARIGVAGYTGYCASKTGLLGLVRAFAAELAPANVQVNALCPGWVATDMAWEGLDGLAAALGTTLEAAHAEAMKVPPHG